MALKHKCPSCGALTIQIVDHEFRIKGVIILWRGCENCGYKWREAYDLAPMRIGLPWTKPPQPGEDGEEEIDR